MSILHPGLLDAFKDGAHRPTLQLDSDDWRAVFGPRQLVAVRTDASDDEGEARSEESTTSSTDDDSYLVRFFLVRKGDATGKVHRIVADFDSLSESDVSVLPLCNGVTLSECGGDWLSKADVRNALTKDQRCRLCCAGPL